ncbi:MAG: transporter permease [Blastococcus sp.]|jgi:NitT/TauT family transport system permease protein|nr:transporter permease [Blastococcus sp.]
MTATEDPARQSTEQSTPAIGGDSSGAARRSGMAPQAPAPRRRTAFRTLRRALAPPLLTLLAMLVVWQLAVWVFEMPSYLVPSPGEVAVTIGERWPLILDHAGVTGLEIVLGFGLAVVVGVSLGVLMVVSSFVDKAMYPLLVTMQAVPKIAIAPILVIWFGFGPTPKVLTAFLVAVFPIVVNTAMGFKQTPVEMIHLSRSMGASAYKTFATFRLPTALPSIFTGLKVAAALSVVGAVSGEFVAANEGLGYLLLTASSTIDSAGVFAGVMALAVQGMLLYGAVELLERLFSPMSRRARRLEATVATA